MTYLDGLVITLGNYVRRYRRRSIVDDNRSCVEASERIEVGLLRTLLCFFVARSAYSFESFAWYHGWDCILQGVCVHVRGSRACMTGIVRLYFAIFFSRIQYVPHSYDVISSASIQSISGQFAGATQKSIGLPIGHDRQFLATCIQLFDQPGIPHVPTIVASALWLRFSDPRPHSEN